MADNYSQFSEMIDAISGEEASWIETVLKLDAEDDVERAQLMKELTLEGNVDLDMWPHFEWVIRDGLWLYCEEGFTEDHLCWFVQAFINKFRPDMIFSVTGASTCSKPRIGEFGGWWLVISKDEIKGGGSWSSAEEAVEEIKNPVDPYWKVRSHLGHLDCFEVAHYGDGEVISSVTVECTKCGEVLHDLYDAGRDTHILLDAKHGEECPICRNGTVEHVDGEIKCRGECGNTVRKPDLWKDDKIQFARLISEITAAMDEKVKPLIKDLATGMDLSHDEVLELFDRAEEVWKDAREKHCLPTF